MMENGLVVPPSGAPTGAGLLAMPVMSLKDLQDQERRKAQAEQAQPLVAALANHVRHRWVIARTSKRNIEVKLLENLRQRNSEYDSETLAEIKKIGGSEIYMPITSVKCRAASSWLRDTLLGSGAEKPWRLDPTPEPDLPPEVMAQVEQMVTSGVQQFIATSGMMPSPQDIYEARQIIQDKVRQTSLAEAKRRIERMEAKMEDQLVEGGFHFALSDFIDDITTYDIAILKGPVMYNRKRLEWQNGVLQEVEKIVPEWERVDPFHLYPAPWSSKIEDGYVIQRHKLTRDDLEALIGVDGYSESAIRTVLEEFKSGRLGEWLYTDSEKARIEGKNILYALHNEDVIDALQLWDTVQGQMLLDWGMGENEITDPARSYACEIWLIGSTVIKAVLNYDRLGRKPYYATSFEKTPGGFYGNGVSSLVSGPQKMCNAAARAVENNMGIASGPQAGVNIDRLPAGENLTTLYPWKIWQYTSGEYGNDTTPPITFFQPQSNAQELMQVYEQFSKAADEISGIPRYMTGENVAGAGRTSSGLSMLINNASKSIKQVISNIDKHVLEPLIERLYQWNQQYNQDPELIGDVNIVARGAMSLVAKEAAQVRRNEFLQVVLTSPMAQQIVGPLGIAELLRENVKALDMNTDHIIPSREEMEMRLKAQQAMAAQMAAQGVQPGQPGQEPNAPAPKNVQEDGSQQGGRESNQMVNHVQ